ncbi:uncharacterized protein BKA78DRAFT_91573 [Phyllosticta capitalensis]|uniref:uncharacterized protein n=1 Tax=Phyllosticta capitalensis TaxID=121624 RepID=UPI00312F2F49
MHHVGWTCKCMGGWGDGRGTGDRRALRKTYRENRERENRNARVTLGTDCWLGMEMGDGGLGLGMGMGIRAALGRWAASMLHAQRGVVDSGACPPLGTGRQQQQASKQQASPGEGQSRRRVQNSPLCRECDWESDRGSTRQSKARRGGRLADRPRQASRR